MMANKVQYLTEIIQGSDEWLELRKNKITATSAYQLLRGKTPTEIIQQKNSAPAFTGNYYTQRGHLLEPEARLLYQQLHKVSVNEVGAIINLDYPNALASPDGLVNNDGGLEIKCFAEKHHLQLFNEIDISIIAQIQFNLLLSERDYWDFFAYNPEMDDLSKVYFEKRIYPDLEMHQKFKDALNGKVQIQT